MIKKQIMYLSLLTFAVFAVLTGCSGGKYAAKVNDHYITKEQLEKRFQIINNFYERTARKLTAGEQKALKKETLDLLIREELVAQEAKNRGIVISDKQVDDHISDIRKKLKNEKEFMSFLKDWGYDTEENYREKVKNELLYQALSERITKDITDPLAKKEAFDRFLQERRVKSTVKVYEKFK